MRTEEVVEEFQAENAEGKVYSVVKIQGTIHEGGRTGRGSSRFELSSGVHVNSIAEDEFEIVWRDRKDNERITRI